MTKKKYVNEFGEFLRDLTVEILDDITGGELAKHAAKQYKQEGVSYTIDKADNALQSPRLRVIWFDNPEYNKWTY